MLRLRLLREEQGKTQTELAFIFKISRQVYANYENEINEPPLKTLIAMADYFQCSTDYLLGRSDDFGNVTISAEFSKHTIFDTNEKQLLKTFKKLPFSDKKTVLEYIEFLDMKRK